MDAINVLNIIDGNVNLALKKVGLPKEEVELMASLRESICRKQCKANNGSTYLNENDKCTACGCNMQAKWRAPEAKCIVGAW